MSELYNRIEMLCEKKKITVTEMCRKTNISRGSLTDLKANRSKSLSQKALSKIADYFEVSIDYVLGNNSESNDTVLDEQLEGIDFALMSETEGLTNEQKQTVINYIKFLKSQD